MLKTLGMIWDFIDKRDIDKHAVCWAVLYGTIIETQWAFAYASAHADRPGLEVAAVIAAVTAPYMALQAAVIKFYFKARTP
jgi:hypothetical protein